MQYARLVASHINRCHFFASTSWWFMMHHWISEWFAPGPMDSWHRLLEKHVQDTKSSTQKGQPPTDTYGLKTSIEASKIMWLCLYVTIRKVSPNKSKLVCHWSNFSDNFWGSLECHGMQPVLGSLQGRNCNATSHLHRTNGCNTGLVKLSIEKNELHPYLTFVQLCDSVTYAGT